MSSLNSFLDQIGNCLPIAHSAIFLVGFTSNMALLLATVIKTPQSLQTYSILIKFGTVNDLVCICCDYFTMQRLLVLQDNLLYVSYGPCSAISARACYLAFCTQFTTLVYSYYVMLASFSYRLYVLNHDRPKDSTVHIIMILALIPPSVTGVAFTFAQADISIVTKFIQENARKYGNESLAGAISGHSGMTSHLIFTILYVILTPGPVYCAVLFMRKRILAKIVVFSCEMSARTRKMHSNLVKALTIHAALPLFTLIGALLYVVLFFDIYYHPTLEKACYVFTAFPPALGAFCHLYYVEPYRRFFTIFFVQIFHRLLCKKYKSQHQTVVVSTSQTHW